MKKRIAEFDRTFGKRVRELRLKLNMSQKELAKKSGLRCNQSISQLEIGQREITANSLHKMSKALCVSMNYLYTGEESLNIGKTNDIKLVQDRYYNIAKEILVLANEIINEYPIS